MGSDKKQDKELEDNGTWEIILGRVLMLNGGFHWAEMKRNELR